MFERVAAQAQASPSLGAESRVRVSLTVARVLFQLRQFNESMELLHKLRSQEGAAEFQDAIDFLNARGLIALGKPNDAETAIIAGQKAASTPAQRAGWQMMFGVLKWRRENPHDALAAFDAVDIAALPPELLDVYDRERSAALWALERQDEAVAVLAGLTERLRARLGPDSPAVYANMREQALLEARRGNFAQAEALSTKLLAMTERNHGRDSLTYLYALELQSAVDEHNGDLQKSVKLHEQMLAIINSHFGERSRNSARMRMSMGSLYNEVGDFVQAEAFLRESVSIGQEVLRPEDGSQFMSRIFLSLFLCQRDKPAQAQEYLHAARESAARYEALSRKELARAIPVIASLAAFQIEPSAANRAALAQVLKDNLGKAKDFMIEQIFKDAAAKARTLGVTPAP